MKNFGRQCRHSFCIFLLFAIPKDIHATMLFRQLLMMLSVVIVEIFAVLNVPKSNARSALKQHVLIATINMELEMYSKAYTII